MKLFSLMVLLCASLGGYAQDIKGRVVEQENGKKVGLPGANVYWAGTTDGVVTDAEGHFKIKWNKSGALGRQLYRVPDRYAYGKTHG